ncbi:serine/threonine-protein phosphatase PGAM5, mitochondrial-like [Centruroides vittatus]|uniref:serine/threonine-protein phosphatase PGAM5, mitochondrial-like n=1 Tax=Centruroides vittatus TaxID=120091 RepID=UPI00350F6060
MSASKLLWSVIGGGITAGCLAISGAVDFKKRANASLLTHPSNANGKWDSNWDRREPSSLVNPPKNLSAEEENRYNESLEQARSRATRHLFLIRHGQYVKEGNSDYDRVLTDLGRKQALRTARRLKDFGFSYTKIIQSSMTRARETSEIIYKLFPEVPLEECDLLREGAPFPPEPPSKHWRPKNHQFFEDGARIEAAFRKYFHRAPASQREDSYEIIVCHANVIRYFICRALQLSPEAWKRFMLFHASITSITIRPSGRVIVFGIGDSGHLPPMELSVS